MFGTGLDVVMPTPVYLAWAVLVLGVVGLAAIIGEGREKGVLGGCVLVVLGLVVALSIAVRPTGFPSRHPISSPPSSSCRSWPARCCAATPTSSRSGRFVPQCWALSPSPWQSTWRPGT